MSISVLLLTSAISKMRPLVVCFPDIKSNLSKHVSDSGEKMNIYIWTQSKYPVLN